MLRMASESFSENSFLTASTFSDICQPSVGGFVPPARTPYLGGIEIDWAAIEASQLEEEKIAAQPDEVFMANGLITRELPGAETLDVSAKNEIEVSALLAGRSLVERLRGREEGDSQYELADALYRAWHMTKQRAGTEQSNLTASLQSFELFCAEFIPDFCPKTIGALMKQIGSYMRSVTGRGTLDVWYDGQEFGRYNYAGEWLNVYASSRHRKYIDKSVVMEIAELGTAWPQPQGLIFHESGSAALASIGAEKAILSGARAIKRGHSIKTGECMEYPTLGGGTRKSIEERASGSIWAAHGMSGDYSTVRWFDEYPVAFGISEAGLVEMRRQQGYQRPEVFDTGEGILAGPEIPLDLVKVVYVPQQDMVRAKEWVQEHCPPDTLVASLEAAESYGWVANRIPELLAQKPVTVPA